MSAPSSPATTKPSSAFIRHWDRVAAVGLILMTVVQQGIWVHLSTAAETWDDDAGLFRLATCMEDGLRGIDGACFAGAPYPPLIPAIAGLHFWVTGERTLQMALHSLWMWPALLCGAVYIGLHRAAGRTAALAGVALAPVVVWALHIRGKFYTEVPLSALVVIGVVCWVASDGFRRRRPSALLGLCLGLGLLTKWSFAFFMGPPMAVAWAIGLGSTARGTPQRWGIGTSVVAAVAAVALGASGHWGPGLMVGLTIGACLAAALGWLWRTEPNRFEADARGRWMNLAIATGLVLVVAGPWYLTHLAGLQSFLSDNLAHRFHGDPIPAVHGIPFYPSVLLTRVLGTPLAALLLVGVVRVLAFRRHPLATWSLVVLVSGVLILGVLPYRAGRYLIAGLGVVVPLIVLSVARPKALARIALPVLLGCGIVHQLSWIPLRSGWFMVPHHWPVFTLPERDLFGNSQRGVADAKRDLLHPRWRFLPVASPPVSEVPAPRAIIRAVSAHSDGSPFLTVVLDPMNKVNVNSLQTELLSVRAPPTSKAVGADIRPTRESIRHWLHQARQPADTPATVRGKPANRGLYIAIATVGNDAPRTAALDRLLGELGWQRLLRESVRDAFSEVDLTVWAEPESSGIR